jgi:hypothetical protein
VPPSRQRRFQILRGGKGPPDPSDSESRTRLLLPWPWLQAARLGHSATAVGGTNLQHPFLRFARTLFQFFMNHGGWFWLKRLHAGA